MSLQRGMEVKRDLVPDLEGRWLSALGTTREWVRTEMSWFWLPEKMKSSFAARLRTELLDWCSECKMVGIVNGDCSSRLSDASAPRLSVER